MWKSNATSGHCSVTTVDTFLKTLAHRLTGSLNFGDDFCKRPTFLAG